MMSSAGAFSRPLDDRIPELPLFVPPQDLGGGRVQNFLSNAAQGLGLRDELVKVISTSGSSEKGGADKGRRGGALALAAPGPTATHPFPLHITRVLTSTLLHVLVDLSAVPEGGTGAGDPSGPPFSSTLLDTLKPTNLIPLCISFHLLSHTLSQTLSHVLSYTLSLTHPLTPLIPPPLTSSHPSFHPLSHPPPPSLTPSSTPSHTLNAGRRASPIPVVSHASIQKRRYNHLCRDLEYCTENALSSLRMLCGERDGGMVEDWLTICCLLQGMDPQRRR